MLAVVLARLLVPFSAGFAADFLAGVTAEAPLLVAFASTADVSFSFCLVAVLTSLEMEAGFPASLAAPVLSSTGRLTETDDLFLSDEEALAVPRLSVERVLLTVAFGLASATLTFLLILLTLTSLTSLLAKSSSEGRFRTGILLLESLVEDSSCGATFVVGFFEEGNR